MQILRIRNGKILDVDFLFEDVPFQEGEMYSTHRYRSTNAVLYLEDAFVHGNKKYWGKVSVHQSLSAYGNSFIQLLPCEESEYEILGLNSKYWKNNSNQEWIDVEPIPTSYTGHSFYSHLGIDNVH